MLFGVVIKSWIAENHKSNRKIGKVKPMGRKFDVIIVGAGAAGMMAGISAARHGASVLILEHMESAGKKILATGNGKCNFTNEKQGTLYYRGKNPAFVLPVFQQFGLEDTLELFQKLGIEPRSKRDGYYYPASGQASAIREVLLMECRYQKIRIAYNVGIRSIQKVENEFIFDTKQGEFQSSTCIIATGGKTAKKTGSDGSGIPYIEGFGHKIIDIVPALVALQGKQSFLPEIAGIRAENRVEIYIENEKIAEETGELQLTEYGVSGIPVFQISRYASYALQEGKEVYILLDFLPWQTEAQTEKMLEERFVTYGNKKSAYEAMIGLFPNKLINVLLTQSGIVLDLSAKNCSREKIKELTKTVRHLRVDITGTKGFESAQVTAGGVDTEEINATTMESKLVSGLYFAGEVIDIDGMCGGYNLQWAWSSGWIAGAYAGEGSKQI